MRKRVNICCMNDMGFGGECGLDGGVVVQTLLGSNLFDSRALMCRRFLEDMLARR